MLRDDGAVGCRVALLTCVTGDWYGLRESKDGGVVQVLREVRDAIGLGWVGGSDHKADGGRSCVW